MGKKRTYQRDDQRPAEGLAPTRSSEWRKTPQEGELVELPSSNVIRCKRPGMPHFVEMGMVPNPLLSIIDASLHHQKTPDVAALVESEEKLDATAKFMDEVWVYCVTEPKSAFRPEDEADHDDDLLYVDDVELEDKIFVFQLACGGTRSVERFREQRLTDMAVVAELQGAGSST